MNDHSECEQLLKEALVEADRIRCHIGELVVEEFSDDHYVIRRLEDGLKVDIHRTCACCETDAKQRTVRHLTDRCLENLLLDQEYNIFGERFSFIPKEISGDSPPTVSDIMYDGILVGYIKMVYDSSGEFPQPKYYAVLATGSEDDQKWIKLRFSSTFKNDVFTHIKQKAPVIISHLGLRPIPS